jgi:hypothetical protein
VNFKQQKGMKITVPQDWMRDAAQTDSASQARALFASRNTAVRRPEVDKNVFSVAS